MLDVMIDRWEETGPDPGPGTEMSEPHGTFQNQDVRFQIPTINRLKKDF